MGKRLIVIDISNFIFRAFYAIRPLHAPDGTPVNAVHGVMSMLLKLLSDYQPDYVVLARDSRGDSFREELDPNYKANRDDPPEELVPQFALIEELIKKMKLPAIIVQRYEADDVIGTVVTKWKSHFEEVFVATGDKDIMQFVDEKVKIIDSMKDKIYGPQDVFDKMGVWPNQIIDYLSMVGDTSDNIPGLKGIGEKGAAKLLAEYKTLDECIKHAGELTNKRMKDAFANYLDDLILSKKLVTIITDLELSLQWNECRYTFRGDVELVNFLKGLGLKQMVSKVEALSYGDHLAEKSEQVQTIKVEKREIKSIPLLNDFKEIDFKTKIIYCQTVESEGQLLGVGLHYDDFGTYLPISHSMGTFDSTLNLTAEELDLFLSNLSKFSGEFVVEKSSQILTLLAKRNLLNSFTLFEIEQAGFVIDAGTPNNLEFLTNRYLSFDLEEFNPSKEISSSEARDKVASRLSAISEIYPRLLAELDKRGVTKVYREIDAPLAPILSLMETRGIRLNGPFLKSLEHEFVGKLFEIEEEIAKVSGERVNLKSPKQVSVLLFEKLGLPVIRKTKTGASTDSDVLEELAAQGGSEIPNLILKYRELDKLLSTYVKVLPLMADEGQRIHTHFHQNVAATGRLSSESPNLQNIPVRSENGRRIRKAFVARPGWLLLSADYSQVELRLLAHFAGDETMIKAFLNGEDIHRQTASEVMSIPLSEVTSDERSKAKAVNFGLMYGQSSFGLSNQLKIGRNEARDYIENYFSRFHKVKAFLDTLKEFAEEHGFVETLHGRRRYLPDIRSTNRVVKSNAERVAINSPIQGSAADIIKLAMIDIERIMRDKKLKSILLLQVHDELIFEVPEDELVVMESVVREKMESVVNLKVPLKVEMGRGVNWFDLK